MAMLNNQRVYIYVYYSFGSPICLINQFCLFMSISIVFH